MAARSYFGKSAKDLALAEGALLAGLTKGPNFYNPDRHPERARERLGYVLTRLQEEGTHHARGERQGAQSDAGADRLRAAAAGASAFILSIRSRARPRAWPAWKALRRTPTRCARPSTSHCSASSNSRCRKASGATSVVPDACGSPGPKPISPRRSRRSKPIPRRRPTSGRTWQRALIAARLPLYDVHWTQAVVVEKPSGRKGEAWRVGLPMAASCRCRPTARSRASSSSTMSCW